MDPASLTVEQPDQPAGVGALSRRQRDADGGERQHDVRRNGRPAYVSAPASSACLAQQHAHSKTADAPSTPRLRREASIAHSNGSYTVLLPTPAVISPDVLSNWSRPFRVTTRPSVQPQAVPTFESRNATHIVMRLAKPRAYARELLGVRVNFYDALNQTTTTLFFPICDPLLMPIPVLQLYLMGSRYFTFQILNSEGASQESMVSQLPTPLLQPDSTSSGSVSQGSGDEAIGASVGSVAAMCVVIAVLVVFRSRRRKSDVFVFPKPDSWEIDPVDIVIGRQLGEGHSGLVNVGTFGDELVAIKSLQPGAATAEVRAKRRGHGIVGGGRHGAQQGACYVLPSHSRVAAAMLSFAGPAVPRRGAAAEAALEDGRLPRQHCPPRRRHDAGTCMRSSCASRRVGGQRLQK